MKPTLTTFRPPTDDEVADMVTDAYSRGLDGDYYNEGTIDWDELVCSYETNDYTTNTTIDLGSSMDSPTVKAIIAAYRKGRRDGKES